MPRFLKTTLLLSAIALSIVGSTSVNAAEFLAPATEDGNVTVRSDEVRKNLYVVGGQVNVNGKTEGDLVAAGGVVAVAGEVSGDVAAASGTVMVTAPVQGDIRAVGGTFTVTAPVQGDVLVAGGSVTIGERASVTGDLLVAGGSVVVDGVIAGGARLAGGVVTVNGTIAGPLEVWADERLSFGESSNVTGPITYHGRAAADVAAGAKVGTINFQKIESPKEKWNNAPQALAGMFAIVRFIAMILFGLLVVRLARHRVTALGDAVRQDPWKHLGIGLAIAVGAPIVCVLLLMTVVGYLIAAVIGLSLLLGFAVSCAIAATIVGRTLLTYLQPARVRPLGWQEVVLGSFILSVLSFIPILGWIVAASIHLMAFGALVLAVKRDVVESA